MLSRAELIKQEIMGVCLDVGCGYYGKFHQVIDGPNIYGIDISREFLKGMDRVVQGDAQRLPFRDCVFGTVVAGDVIEHLPEPELFVREAYRALRQGGRLIITTHNRNSWLNRLTHCYHHRGHVSLMDAKQLKHIVGDLFPIGRFSYTSSEGGATYLSHGAMEQYISIGYGRGSLNKILRLSLVRKLTCWLEDHRFFLRVRRAVHLFLPPPLREEMLMICIKRAK